ncbi:prolipoprotein diacylglyceryl transferase [Spirosoma aureum]|uniref:Phosphatidylglycerol--prolipoprotein diacylglyceryl transferase n=1 Tax=Spirosoma aureum TaxID=2692134 RepID=A0A6G9ANA4_9BACT|nr:prolipoprotein diacylglyceryl transferase [Spirosoma aureum]QIP13755.1 prolipoprotein diacylglyceryl transferase [Spirosoma aureum]
MLISPRIGFLPGVIIWTAKAELFRAGPFVITWYGLCFALSFIIGLKVITYIFNQENKPTREVDSLLLYLVISTIGGARLGHFLIYEPTMLWQHPLEVLLPPYRSLASHGAAIGILLGLFFYTRTRQEPGESFLWVGDRIAIVVALSGCFIRLGNPMNSEIIGRPTRVPWGFIFVNNTEYSNVPRHPAQLYEALTCLLLFGVLLWIWFRDKASLPHGLLIGVFLTWVFSLRFLYEFIKENQVPFEDQMRLNVGQLLSVPAVLIGVFLLIRSYNTVLHRHLPG